MSMAQCGQEEKRVNIEICLHLHLFPTVSLSHLHLFRFFQEIKLRDLYFYNQVVCLFIISPFIMLKNKVIAFFSKSRFVLRINCLYSEYVTHTHLPIYIYRYIYMCMYIYIYTCIFVSLWTDHSWGWSEGSLFNSYNTFPWIVPLTIHPYLIMLSVKKRGIKYHFLSSLIWLNLELGVSSWCNG